MSDRFSADAFYLELEETGERVVRDRLAQGHYGERKIPLATQWLQTKDEDRSDASKVESLRIARSAKNAAWVAAISAIVAVAVSTIAFVRSLSS